MKLKVLLAGLCGVLVVSTMSWLAFRYVTGPGAESKVDACLESLPPPQSKVTGLLVEPDDGYEPVIEEIDRAACDIRVNIYLLGDDVIVDGLIAAHERGVRVRVQMEEDPFGGGLGAANEAMQELSDVGIDWQWTPAHFQFSHAKYLVVDEQVALVLNQNLTESAFYSNREFGLVTTEPDQVAELVHVFDRDWAHQPLDAAPLHIVTSPENSRQQIVSLIASATVSIDFYAEVIRDDEFIVSLLDAERRGVDVRLVINESSDELDVEVEARLAEGGVEIRYSQALYIHAKAMIFDGRVAFIGSQNPTSNSFENNREVGIVADDPIVLERVRGIFARDWVRGIPASPKRASSHDISS